MYHRTIFATFLFIPGLAIISGCSGEPSLPTSDPMEKVQKRSQGYSVRGHIAVDAQNNFYHMQRLVSGSHSIDVETAPASFTQVPASCNVSGASSSDEVHLIVSRGGRRSEPLSKKRQLGITAFSTGKVEEIAQKRAKSMRETGTPNAVGRGAQISISSLSKKEIVVTAHQNPVYLVLTGRYPTLYNFTVAPYSKISGVLVYTDDAAAAVSGLDPSVPVFFKSAGDPKTKKCFVRSENKPDETWTGHKQAMRITSNEAKKQSRYHALGNVYKKFSKSVVKDVGRYADQRFINVESASFFLVGPAPTQVEQRIPYSPIAGSHIRVMSNDFIEFGNDKKLNSFVTDKVNARYNEILATGE